MGAKTKKMNLQHYLVRNKSKSVVIKMKTNFSSPVKKSKRNKLNKSKSMKEYFNSDHQVLLTKFFKPFNR